MENIDLDELMRLHAAATPVPWEVTDKCAHLYVTDSNPNREIAKIGWKPKAYVENASYIVAACNAVPELVSRIRELETEIKRRDAEIWASLCNECAIDDVCPYCGTCPFDGKKCKEVTPEDWIRWMEENNGN